MAKCEVCQKDMFFGRKIRITRSQISRRALTQQKANVQKVKVVVTLENDEKEVREYHVSELKFRPKKRKEHVDMDDELKQLEMLEKKEGKSRLNE